MGQNGWDTWAGCGPGIPTTYGTMLAQTTLAPQCSRAGHSGTPSSPIEAPHVIPDVPLLA